MEPQSSPNLAPTTTSGDAPSGTPDGHVLPTIPQQIATAIGGAVASVEAALQMLAAGYAPSFIARHRKAQTKGLTTADLVRIANMQRYVASLATAREAATAALAKFGPISPELEAQLASAPSKYDLNDFVVEAQSAQAHGHVALVARRDVRQAVRQLVWQRGSVVVGTGEAAQPSADVPHSYEQFLGLNEKVALIPANRYLAICRGEAEHTLTVHIELDAAVVASAIKALVGQGGPVASGAPQDVAGEAELNAAASSLLEMASADVRAELRERSESTSIDGLGEHLRKLLTAAALGHKPLLAVVPRLGAACEAVALDETGRLVATYTLAAELDEPSLAGLLTAAASQRAGVVAIGNGPGGMELYVALRKHARARGVASPPILLVEDAASMEYATSELARRELAHVDLSLRAAVWLGRRMQDPLAELVKLPPVALAGPADHPGRIALGLAAHLQLVMIEAVTDVGVDLNTATAEQLTYIVGLGAPLAAAIVAHRNVIGAFRSRDELLQVAGMTPLAYEQAVSFLRVLGGSEPLDQTRLHPSQYEAARALAAQIGASVGELLGKRERLAALDLAALVTPERSRGLVAWLLSELGSPWRDRRQPFKAPKRRDDLVDIHDLKPGMTIDGLVASVAPFGLFVDLGIYQDGLVHISQILKRFGRDAARVAVVGAPLRVTVVEVDIPRKRISLLPAAPEARAPRGAARPPREPQPPRIAQKQAEPSPQLLAALAKPVALARPAQATPRRGGGPKAPGGGPAFPSGRGAVASHASQGGRGESRSAGARGDRSRAPRHAQLEEAQVEAQPGFGLSGFTNSPFAKLANLKK